MTHIYTVGIDIGGTNTDMGLIRDDGTIIARRNIPTNRYTDFALYVKDMMQEIDDMVNANGVCIDGIGIGAPNGNFYTGCVDNAPNLTIKGVLNFQKEIAKYRSEPVVLSNDANAAAYGEMIYGGAKDLNNFIMFTLGTGVGSGIVIDGVLVHGKTGCAGELGHNILIPGGRQCSCGRKGCLETYTSARGIVQTFCELRASGLTSSITAADAEVTSKMIGDAANAGDEVALKCYDMTAHYLGIAMANAVTFSSPQAIFLMGGPTKVGRPLLLPLRKYFNEYILNIFQGSCEIRMSELATNEVAILGAAALVKLKIK